MSANQLTLAAKKRANTCGQRQWETPSWSSYSRNLPTCILATTQPLERRIASRSMTPSYASYAKLTSMEKLRDILLYHLTDWSSILFGRQAINQHDTRLDCSNIDRCAHSHIGYCKHEAHPCAHVFKSFLCSRSKALMLFAARSSHMTVLLTAWSFLGFGARELNRWAQISSNRGLACGEWGQPKPLTPSFSRLLNDAQMKHQLMKSTSALPSSEL
eukprot:6467341-Amphidinium_carterae.1